MELGLFVLTKVSGRTGAATIDYRCSVFCSTGDIRLLIWNALFVYGRGCFYSILIIQSDGSDVERKGLCGGYTVRRKEILRDQR